MLNFAYRLDQGGIAGLTIGLLIAFASFLGVLMSAVKIYSKFKERKQGEVDFEEYIDHGANDGTQPVRLCSITTVALCVCMHAHKACIYYSCSQ